jgi:hypothetical protein
MSVFNLAQKRSFPPLCDGGCASGKPENPAFSVIFLYHSTKNVELLGGFYFYTAEDELLMTNIAN